MATRVYTTKTTFNNPNGAFVRNLVDYSNSSNSSPRVNGKLVLIPNSHSLQVDKLYGYSFNQADALSKDVVAPQTASRSRNNILPVGTSSVGDDNRAYGRLFGDLKYQGANLGVTLTQWRESRDMITQRLQKVDRVLRITEKRLQRNLRYYKARHRYRRSEIGNRPLLKPTRDPLASQVVEYAFGWAPLYSDIENALTTVIPKASPDEYHSRASRSNYHTVVQNVDTNLGKHQTSHLGYRLTTLSCAVAVQNPNLWLANRAGLVNPLTVAWDLVPWSFVVNMFVNVNQVLNSLSNEFGLSIKDKNTTRSIKMHTFEFIQKRSSSKTGFATTKRHNRYVSKVRQVGSFPTPTLVFKVPDFTWQTVTVASALVIQRMSKVSNLIDLVYLASRK